MPCAARLRQLLRRAGKKRERLLQIPLVELGTVGPVEPRRVAGEAEVLPRLLRHARQRHGLALRPDLDAAPGLDEGRDVGVEALAEAEPLAVGRDRELRREVRDVVLVRLGAVELDRGEDALLRRDLVPAALGLDEEDAVARLAEARQQAVLGDERGLAAGRRHLVEAGIGGPGRRDEIAAVGLAVDDPRSVGREDRLVVVAGLVGDRLRDARGHRRDADRAQRLVVPGRVDERLRVARPRREVLVRVRLLRQPLRRPVRQIANVDEPQRRIRHALPVRRHGHPPQHADGEDGGSCGCSPPLTPCPSPRGRGGFLGGRTIRDPLSHRERAGVRGAPSRGAIDVRRSRSRHHPRQHIHRKPHRRRRLPRVLHVKRNLVNLLPRQIHPLDEPPGPEHHRLRIRRPSHPGINPLDRPRLLHVPLEPVVHRPLDTRLEVLHEQHRLGPNPPHERERLPVRRRRRPDRPARPGHVVDDLPRVAVEPLDDVDLPVRVLVVLPDLSGRRVGGPVEVPAVGRERGLPVVLLLGRALGHLQALAARAVIEPDLARAERARAGVVLARRDELRVGRPGGAVRQAEALLRHLLRVLPVAVHDPDVVAARAVGRERDPLAVRRIARLHVPRDAGRQRPRLAAPERDRVDVAEKVEDDLLPVRRHVERHPRAGRQVERDGVVVGIRRVRHVPLRLLFLLLLRRIRRRRRQRRLVDRRLRRLLARKRQREEQSQGGGETVLHRARSFR